MSENQESVIRHKKNARYFTLQEAADSFTQEDVTRALEWIRVYAWTYQHLISESNRELGRARTNTLDPLCLYLTEVLGGQWSIGTSLIHSHEKGQTRFTMPTWVRVAMQEMDKDDGIITASRFEAILQIGADIPNTVELVRMLTRELTETTAWGVQMQRERDEARKLNSEYLSIMDMQSSSIHALVTEQIHDEAEGQEGHDGNKG